MFLSLYMLIFSSFISVLRVEGRSKSPLKQAPALEKKEVAAPPSDAKRGGRHVQSQSPVQDPVTVKYVVSQVEQLILFLMPCFSQVGWNLESCQRWL